MREQPIPHTEEPWEVDDSHCRTSINAPPKHIAMVNYMQNADPAADISIAEHKANAAVIVASARMYHKIREALKARDKVIADAGLTPYQEIQKLKNIIGGLAPVIDDIERAAGQ